MALQDDIRHLASNPTLGDLEPDALRLLAFSAETRILRAGDILFRAGDPSDGGYLALSGAIALDSGHGPASIVRPPTLIGDVALVAATNWPCTALAREPSSVLKISRPLFVRILSEYPGSAVRLRQSMGKRLSNLRDELDRFRSNLI